MNDPKREAINRLNEEERQRRLREGGESMRAQLAMEEAQRGARSGQEGTGFAGLTPQEEERRRTMGGKMGESYPGMGESQQAEMAMWGREGQREPSPRREGPAAGRRDFGTTEKVERGDYGKASGGGTYYYEGRESQASGLASPESSFGRTEYTPSGKPPITKETTTGERMRETGTGAVASATQMGGQAMEKSKEMGEQAWAKTKAMGAQLTERTREATGGASAEDVASRAGESIGRGIRKAVAVGTGIVAGLRRGMGEGRERTMEEGGETREYTREETQVTPSGELREKEYREVRRKEPPR